MRKSITQELDYGCGVACFAFVSRMSFKKAVNYLGRDYSVTHGWRPSDLVRELDRYGLAYKSTYVRQKEIDTFTEGTIVLIERSHDYPVGHYLVSHKGYWMDPWINMPENNDIAIAKSGFRKELPGRPMYALLPLLSI